MAFGFLAAPAAFQAVIEWIIDQMSKQLGRKLQARVYIDDTFPHGIAVSSVWEDTKRVIQAYVEAGLLINLSKCMFLVADVVALGFALANREYRLGNKAITKLLSAQIPRNLKEL